MHKVFAITAIVPSLLGALTIGFMFYGLWTEGFASENGMTILAFQLYGFLLSIIGFGLSSVALMIANRLGEKTYQFNYVTIVISLLSLASMIIGLGFL